MAVVFRVGLRQRPPEKKGEEGRVRGQPVPSLVPLHELTTAKPRYSSAQALGFSAETDSLLEGNGFELPVPGEIRSGFEGSAELRPIDRRRGGYHRSSQKWTPQIGPDAKVESAPG